MHIWQMRKCGGWGGDTVTGADPGLTGMPYFGTFQGTFIQLLVYSHLFSLSCFLFSLSFFFDCVHDMQKFSGQDPTHAIAVTMPGS